MTESTTPQTLGMAYDAELYELTHRGNKGDVSFYLSACKGKSKVLELGCGMGRILLPLAEHGYNVTGIDYHAQMLATLQQRIDEHPGFLASHTRLFQADIRNFQLDETFDRILLPFNVLYCLTTQEDIVTCLRTVRQHLAPNGACIFDIYLVEEEDLAAFDPDTWEPYVQFSASGRKVEIYEKRVWQPELQRIDASYMYRITERGKVREEVYELPQCYLFPAQCKALLQEAGLMATQVYGDFRGGAFTDESEHLVVWAKSNPHATEV